MVQLAGASRQLVGREGEGQPSKHVVGHRTTILTQGHAIVMGRRPPGPMSASDKEAIRTYLKDLAGRLGTESVSSRLVKADGHVSPATIYRAFGSFSEALRQAGLRPSRAKAKPGLQTKSRDHADGIDHSPKWLGKSAVED